MVISAQREPRRQIAALQKQLVWITLCEWGLWVLLAGAVSWLVDDRQLSLADLLRIDRRVAVDASVLAGVRNFLLLDACLIVCAQAARRHLRALLEQLQTAGPAAPD